jgi:hypothetical protein
LKRTAPLTQAGGLPGRLANWRGIGHSKIWTVKKFLLWSKKQRFFLATGF